MRPSTRTSGIVWMLSALLLVVGIAACEDDPILEPHPKDSGDGGSYGKLSLPEASAAVADRASTNPELF